MGKSHKLHKNQHLSVTLTYNQREDLESDYSDLNDLAKSIGRFRKSNYIRRSVRILAVLCAIVLGTAIFISNTSAGAVVNIATILKGGRYLVLLGNNTELRPGGGFIGSFAIVDTRELVPKIEYFETNIYKHDNQFAKENFVEMPKPLSEILGTDKSWQLHDSNWSADFPTAARTSLWFYNMEYRDQLDGVILVNATSVRDILALTGPISAPNTNLTLGYDNFFPVLSNAIEKEYWEDPRNEDINEPKVILKDYMPSLENKIFELPKWQLLSFINRAALRKDLLFYSVDNAKQKIIEENNYAGEIKTEANFIYIANATIGSKTSLAVSQDAIYNVDQINHSASLQITRIHNGKAGEFDGGINTNYTIVHLPKGFDVSSVKAGGEIINIDKESFDNYETFGFWTNLSPGQSVQIDASISLPADYNAQNILIIKQPGSANETYTIINNNKSTSFPLDKNIAQDLTSL